MPRYVRMLNASSAIPRVSDTLAEWVDIDQIIDARIASVGGGSFSLETPTGSVNGVNDDFVFSGPPIMVFRNGVNETRLGSIAGSTFTFDSPPETGDDIEGLV